MPGGYRVRHSQLAFLSCWWVSIEGCFVAHLGLSCKLAGHGWLILGHG